ncbi:MULTISPECIES: hypothetical protein [Micromonospora]|uniref:ATP-grasp target RiPP n=1 Tax=Micromonospora gifhornensis TaxID=84594 RepID=A0ABQ4I957_9ACTN|nr:MULTISPECIES: hypothetical protein [Micromonospora]GIJ14416.1 hypothetical protein Vgi01_11000 [Micromonospora gifhornensis]
MTTDDDQASEALPAGWAPVHDLPGTLPINRLDYGDAEQLAEMTGTTEAPEEPLILVDEPVPHRPPYDRAQKRRNQRPVPR